MEFEELHSLPAGDLALIAMKGTEEIADKINKYLVDWRQDVVNRGLVNDDILDEYNKDSYMLEVKCPRFGTGEAKGLISQTVRGNDLYILCDCFNYGITYKMYGKDVPMSPDDHFADLKRIIAATYGKTHRITVIMPMLYESRQHRRTARESLDCAMALQELTALGVDNIITFDAHDARVQNAIPTKSFESIPSTYQMIKSLVNVVPDIKIDKDHLMVISPDEGGIGRCLYYANFLSIDLGMFYKRRDYSVIVNGRNPIVSHEFLGDNVEGKDMIIVDDMISSGDSIIDIAKQLKERKANRIFACVAFGLFVEGLEVFDKAYEDGLIEKVFTTNLIYRTPELRKRPWYCEVDMSKYIAYIINTLNHEKSLGELLDPSERVEKFLVKKGFRTAK